MAKSTFNELIKSSTPVLIDFSAEWCGPCKMLGPILLEVKNSIGSKGKIIKIDVDRNPEIAGKYRIQSVPTLMIFKDGEMRWRGSGVIPANQLEELINQHQ